MASKKYEIVSTVLSISVLVILFSTDVFAACKNWRQTLTYYGSGRNEVVGGNNWRWPIYSDSIHFSLGGNDVLTGRTGRDCVALWGGPGNDTYKAVRGGNFSIYDSSGRADTLNLNPFRTRYIVTGQYMNHLFLWDTSNNGVVGVLRWKASKSRIERWKIGGQKYSYKAIRKGLPKTPGWLGSLTQRELRSLGWWVPNRNRLNLEMRVRLYMERRLIRSSSYATKELPPIALSVVDAFDLDPARNAFLYQTNEMDNVLGESSFAGVAISNDYRWFHTYLFLGEQIQTPLQTKSDKDKRLRVFTVSRLSTTIPSMHLSLKEVSRLGKESEFNGLAKSRFNFTEDMSLRIASLVFTQNFPKSIVGTLSYTYGGAKLKIKDNPIYTLKDDVVLDAAKVTVQKQKVFTARDYFAFGWSRPIGVSSGSMELLLPNIFGLASQEIDLASVRSNFIEASYGVVGSSFFSNLSVGHYSTPHYNDTNIRLLFQMKM